MSFLLVYELPIREHFKSNHSIFLDYRPPHSPLESWSDTLWTIWASPPRIKVIVSPILCYKPCWVERNLWFLVPLSVLSMVIGQRKNKKQKRVLPLLLQTIWQDHLQFFCLVLCSEYGISLDTKWQNRLNSNVRTPGTRRTRLASPARPCLEWVAQHKLRKLTLI